MERNVMVIEKKIVLFLCAAFSLILLSSAFCFSETLHIIPIQGVAKDTNFNLVPLGNISVRIYPTQINQSPVYSNNFLNAINDGIYDMQLSVNLDNTKKYYLELDINGEEVIGDAAAGREEFYPGGGDHTHTHQGLFNASSNGLDIFNLARHVGLGLTQPGERLHIGDGNILIEGGGETALMFKRDITYTGGPSGTSQNPIFKFGRIIQAGDNDTEVRVIYSDDLHSERSVFEFDQKGIVASVKPFVGSHFEGFVMGDVEPRFRLNSYPFMQLELGAGENYTTDVAIRRSGVNRMSFITGATNDFAIEKMIIDENGNVGIGLSNPVQKLDINGPMRLTPTDAQGACTAIYRGSIYYDNSLNEPCFCSGTEWRQFDGGGVC